MPDAQVRATIQVAGGPAALAELRAFRQAVADIGGAQAKATLGVDSSALTAAKADVQSLGSAHQALAAKPVALGVDVAQIEQARSSVKNLDNDLLSLVASAGKVGPAFALGVAAGGLTKFAADYQTLMQTTVNQTNLGADAVAGLDRAIRGLPSGGAPLADLAQGMKNISDLGYSMADATKIATEESKAATETGANQATTMLAITSAMKEYNATADEVAKYTNIVAESAKLGNTSLQAWTEGTRTGVAVAAAYGVSLQEADAFMVALTRHGFDAAESATQLRGVIQHIVNPNAAAQQTIAEVTKATNIPLDVDFSDAGLKARGFAQVMQDLQDVVAKTGDESIVTRLIPALRGGQGALITVTQAAADSKQALADLGQAADGSLTPVEDGFAAIQQTAGYQFGQTMKQLKFDLIDIGQAGLPPVTALAHALGEVPEPVIRAGVEIGLAAAAIKTASVAADLLAGGAARLGTAIAGGTAATVADTAAVAANTAALAANAEARGAVAASVAVRDVETAGAAATIGSAVAGIGKTLGRLVVPVSIGLVAYEIVGKPVEDAIRQKVSELERPQADLGTLNTDDEASFEAGIRARLDTQQRIVDEYNRYKESAGYKVAKIENLGGELQSDRDYKNAVANIEALKKAEADYQQTRHNATPLGPPLPPNYSAAGIGLPTAEEVKQQAAEAKASADSQAAYFKSLDADVAAARKQATADAVAKQKADIQSAADAEVAAATKSADAWKAATAEVGRVDLSKGLAGLADAAPGLDKVVADLAAIGESDTALSSLTALADAFKGIGDAEKAATTAYQGYLLTLDNTDQGIQKLEALKKRYDDAADAALRAQRAGTATPSQDALVANRGAVDANIAGQIGRLQTGQAGDLLAAVRVAPDFAGWDDAVRAQVAKEGGGQGLIAKVAADTTRAESDLTAFEAKDRQAIVTIKADTKDALANVDAFVLAIPSDRTTTVHVQYVGPDGTPLDPARLDNPGGPGGMAGGPLLITTQPGQADPARGYGAGGYNPAQVAASEHLTTQQSLQQQGDVAGGGAMQTPRGNAAALKPLSALIDSAAQAYGVPAWLIGAVIMHESGGVVGAVQQGGLGRGLMQVDIGQGHADNPLLTDTSMAGAKYQIDAGTKILADMIASRGTTQGIQGYAGPAYQSQAGGGVPAGLNLPTELARYYQQPVMNALGGDSTLTAQAASASSAASPAGGVTPDTILATARQFLGEQKDRVGRAVYGWCEEIVGDIVQTAGATNYRPTSADQHLKDALAGVPGAGRVIDASQAQPGDLVAWSGSDPRAGDPRGHIGVFSGGGNYIGTTTNGVQERPLPAGATFIRPDGVVAGGPVPGSTMYSAATVARSEHLTATQTAASATAPAPAGGGASDLTDPNSPAAQDALAQKQRDADDFALSLRNIAAAGDLASAALNKLNPQGMQAATAEFQRMQPVFQKMQEASLPADATASDKQIALNKAWGQTLEYEAAYAKLLSDMEGHTGDLTADTKALSDVVGALGPQYAQAAVASAQVATANNQIATLQQQQTQADQAHAAVVAQRQADDQASSRAQTTAGWAAQDAAAAMQARQQAAANRIQDATTAENSGYTRTQRDEQDRQRALQFSQQVGATDLQNQLTDLQKGQQSAVYQRTSAEQLQAATVRGAGTNEEAGAAAAQLAAMHDRDLAQRDLDAKAIDDIQARIRAEQKKAALDSYNLETETIAASRAHENRLAQLAAEGTAQQRTAQREQQAETEHQQAIQRSAQLQAWQLADSRAAEDRKYADEKAANAAAQEAQRQIAATAQASLAAAQQALSVWQETGQVVAAAGQAAASAATNPFPSTPVGAPGSGTIRTLSGMSAGGDIPIGAEAMVGDAPGGVATPYSEKVRVTSRGAIVTPLADRPPAPGGGTTITIGDITIQAGGDDEAVIARALALFEGRLRRAMRAGRDQRAAVGR